MSEQTIFETCRLVLDRALTVGPGALVYVAEGVIDGRRQTVASSPVFNPTAESDVHRLALAALEARLQREGWIRDPIPSDVVIGARFYRWRSCVV